MKIIEGQLQLLQMISDFSAVSDSGTSRTLREFVKVVAQSQQIGPDIVPRWIKFSPMVDEQGKMSAHFIERFEGDVDLGRLVNNEG